MTDEEYAGFKADIQEHGQREPIVMHEGQILDGRNRYRACAELDREPQTTDYIEAIDGSPVAYVISKNLHRRHLSIGQRTVIAVEALPIFEVEARERQREAGGRGREGGRGHKKGETLPEIFPEGFGVPVLTTDRPTQDSRTQAAAAFSVNPHYVSDVKKLKEEAPDLVDRIRSGRLTVSAAKREVKRREGGIGTKDKTKADTKPKPSPKKKKVAPPSGASLLIAWDQGRTWVESQWMEHEPAAVASTLQGDKRLSARAFTGRLQTWLAALVDAIGADDA